MHGPAVNPDNAGCRLNSPAAPPSHWSPGLVPEENFQALRETVFSDSARIDSAPTEQDEINSSLCHGFIFDFCGVEIDPNHRRGAHRQGTSPCTTAARILHPGMVAGQITGGFAHAPWARRCTRNLADGPETAVFPLARLPTIWCQPRWKW